MLTKESALRFAKRSTPLYSKLFQELRAEGGRVRISKRYAKHRQDLGTTYVLLYDDERKPTVAITLALLGEEGFKKLNEDELSLPSSNQLRYFDSYNRRRPHSTLDGQTPDTAYFTQPLLVAAA